MSAGGDVEATEADREALREAVSAQAEALIAGDTALFASWATTQALPGLYRAPKPLGARAFEIIELEMDGEHGESVVQFRGAGTYALRGSWRRTEAGWRAVTLDVPADSVQRPWWRRFLGRGPQQSPERQDLS